MRKSPQSARIFKVSYADNSEHALAYEVRAASLSAVQQYGAKVHYKDILVGEYFVDLLINDMISVELKTVNTLDDAHMPPGACPGGRMHASII